MAPEPASPSQEVPGAVTVHCPTCDEETLHAVLRGTRSGKKRKEYVLQATVECAECGHVHPVTLREPGEVEVPVVISHGGQSRTTRVELPADAQLKVGDMLIVEDFSVKVTGLELDNQRRVEEARADEVRTLWVTEWESVTVNVGVNLGRKTIMKKQQVLPETEYEIGQRLLLGRLDVTIHSIKTHERLITRGSARAENIARINAKPTLFPKPYRPPKPIREQRRREWEGAEGAE